MSLYLGRVDVSDTEIVDFDGDRKLSLRGDLHAASLDAAQTLRQQILGLTDTARGESVHRVTFSEDTTVDGFYRLTRPPKVGTVEGSYATNWFKYDAELERVDGGYQLPIAESYLSGVARSGKPGGVTEVYWHAVPSTKTSYDFLAAANSSTASRTGPGGTARYMPSSSYAAGFARTRIVPASWYDMASTVKVNAVEVVGGAVVNAPTSWELGNGYVRIQSCSVSTTKTFEVVGPAATSSNWGTAQGYCVGYYGGGAWNKLGTAKILAVEVLRNQPWCAAIRLVCGFSIYGDGVEFYVDLRLRRGSAIIEATISAAQSNASWKWGVEQTGNATHAVIGVGGGLRPSADDADGNRWCLMTGTSTDNATAQGDLGGSTSWPKGRMYQNTAGASIDFGFAYERAGGSSAAPNRSTDLRDQYFAAQDEIVHFGVAR